MAVLTVQDASDSLEAIVFAAAAAGGDQVPSGTTAGGWSLPVAVIVRNDAVDAMTATVEGVALAIPAGGEAIAPARGAVAFGDLIGVTYSAVTSVTVAAVRLTGL